jgi:CRP-like cAMP-binding protein
MSLHGTSQLISNSLLANLPADLLAHLMSKFTEVDLPARTILISSDRPIEHAYFPLRGLISLVKSLQDGSMVEVGLVGKEGFTGVPLALGETTDAIDSQVQIPRAGLRISALAFREEVNRSRVFQSSLLRFANALTAQIAQTAACNGRHAINERLARWLLMASDRVGDNSLSLSHEFLSVMLGARRPGVTVALGTFKHAGLISNSYHEITILDRPGMEEAACECYSAGKHQFDRLLQ